MVLKRPTYLEKVLLTREFAAPELLLDVPYGFPSSDSYAVIKTILFIANGGQMLPGGYENNFIETCQLAQDHPWRLMMLQVLQSDAYRRPTAVQVLSQPFWNTLDADIIVAGYIDAIYERARLSKFPPTGLSEFRPGSVFIQPHAFKVDDLSDHEYAMRMNGPLGFPVKEEQAKRAQYHTGGAEAIIGSTQEEDPKILALGRLLCTAQPSERIRLLLMQSEVPRDQFPRVLLCSVCPRSTFTVSFAPFFTLFCNRACRSSS
jgi:hypothetical protein